MIMMVKNGSSSRNNGNRIGNRIAIERVQILIIMLPRAAIPTNFNININTTSKRGSQSCGKGSN